MKKLDLTGQRFGSLTVLNQAGRKGKNLTWLCQCDCGNTKIIEGKKLRSGDVKSCGCQHYKACITHGMADTRLYHIWCTMKARCNRPTSNKYSRYGARGIRLCKEWQRFEPFKDWALANGYRDDLSIDRINNDGNYEPDNCRWADAKTQANNTSRVRKFVVDGKLMTVAQISIEHKISHKLLTSRLSKGWSIEEAIATPKLATGAKRKSDEKKSSRPDI